MMKGKAAAVTPETAPPPASEIQQIATLMSRPQGASAMELRAATGWQALSVRGVIAGGAKKKLGMPVSVSTLDGERTYRMPRTNAARPADTPPRSSTDA